ncbi:hypothetical protein OUZ56_016295 [Daphnia magna]|uniref:Uncharacterized protein n=1 Tax=Daphnia magna TaxID=35525 RepID=A0ABR0AQ83_9CRUS|nr:hypothetical protein OUZ56_016295 [Daphnia magna]
MHQTLDTRLHLLPSWDGLPYTKLKTHGITVYSHRIQKDKLIISQCIHIEYKSKKSLHHSVFTLNTKVLTYGITVYSH